jgi:hypothetical protein
VFCGYANGISVLLNEKICQMAERRKELGSFSPSCNILLFIIVAVFLPFLVIVKFAGMNIIYDILVSRPLYMHRTRTKEIKHKILSTGSAAVFNQNTLFDMLILHSKIIVIRLIEALEQIESSWCPLKHKKAGAGVKDPLHHRNFFEPDELEKLRRSLYRNGTVSNKKPLVKITNPVYPSGR